MKPNPRIETPQAFELGLTVVSVREEDLADDARVLRFVFDEHDGEATTELLAGPTHEAMGADEIREWVRDELVDAFSSARDDEDPTAGSNVTDEQIIEVLRRHRRGVIHEPMSASTAMVSFPSSDAPRCPRSTRGSGTAA